MGETATAAGLADFAAAVAAHFDAGGSIDGFQYPGADPALLDAVRRCAERPDRGLPKIGFGICDKCGQPAILTMNTARRKTGAKCRMTPKCEGRHIAVEFTR